MKSHTTRLLVALFAGAALLASLPAQARNDGRDHREWRTDTARPDHGYRRDAPRWAKEHRAYKKHRRNSVIVHQYEYYRPHYYAPPPRYYYPPPPPRRYYYSDPSIVIGINIPPLIIPLR